MLNNTNQQFVYHVILQNTPSSSFGLENFFTDFYEIAVTSKPMLFNDCIRSCRALLTRMHNLASASTAGSKFEIGVETNPEISGIPSISGGWADVEVMKWWIYNPSLGSPIVPMAKAVMTVVQGEPRVLN